MKTCDSDTLQELLRVLILALSFCPVVTYFSPAVRYGCYVLNITSLSEWATRNAVHMHCPFPSKRQTMMASQNKDECHIIAFYLAHRDWIWNWPSFQQHMNRSYTDTKGTKTGGKNTHRAPDICTFNSTGSKTQTLEALDSCSSVWLHNPADTL